MYNIEVFEFEGDDIQLVRNNETGEVRVPVNSLAKNVGVGERALRKKVQDNPIFAAAPMGLRGTDGRMREFVTIPLEKVQALLLDINSNKVKDPEARIKLRAYQEKLAIALHDYATKGIAVNPDKVPAHTVVADIAMSPRMEKVLDNINRLTEQNNAIINMMIEEQRAYRNLRGDHDNLREDHNVLEEKQFETSKRVTEIEEYVGDAGIPDPRYVQNMDTERVREKWDTLVQHYAHTVYGSAYEHRILGNVMNLFYREFDKLYPGIVFNDSMGIKSKIKRVEMAGLIRELYGVSYKLLADKK